MGRKGKDKEENKTTHHSVTQRCILEGSKTSSIQNFYMVEVAVPFAFPLTLIYQYFLVSKIFLNRILVIFLNYIVKFLLDIYFNFFYMIKSHGMHLCLHLCLW